MSSTASTSTAAGALFAASSDPSRPILGERRSEADQARRRRRWLVWGSSVLAVLVVLRLAAPPILAWWVTARLSEALGVSAEVEDVELGLLRGEITVRGLHVAPTADATASSLDIDAFALCWRWRELMHGLPELHGRVSGLDVVVDLHQSWPAVGDAEGSRLSRLRSLSVEGGSVRVVLTADAPPLVALTDLHARVDASPGLQGETMTTQISVTARAGEDGSLTLDGALAPADPAASWSLRFALERLDLRPLNPLFQRVLEMDVEQGWLSLDGWATVGFGRLRGQLLPRFEELQLLGRGETRVRHPMAEALFSEMLSGADLPVDIDRAAGSSGGSLLDAVAHVDAMELLGRIILRGFTRRLDTLEGYDPTVARVEVDFPAGRLSFFDIALTREGGAIDRPFVSIARMDIVVEQSAVDREVLTYKAIALHEPTLTFVTGRTPSTSQITFDPEWQEKVNVLPYPTDRVEIFDGRVEYRDDTTHPPTSLVLSDLELRADNLGRAEVHGARRGAGLEGTARAMDRSPLAIEIDFTPGVVDLDAAIRLRLEPVPLRELDQLLEGRLGIDVSSGTLALTADLDAHAGHLRGTIEPELRDVRVLGVDEVEVDHPVREIMLERRLRKLDGTTLTLDHHVRTSVVRELPAALLSAARRVR